VSNRCKLTGKGPLVGNNVSHAHNKTKMRQLPNLQWKRIFVPEENRFVRIRVSTSALRTITHKGMMHYLASCGLKLSDL
jgi:large subunit ribosomal protein L28